MVKSQPLKQIRYDEDLISKLPDSLLTEILSRLPSTKDTVITGALSKRWQHVWTYVPTLIFLHPYESHHHANPDFFSFVNKTLTQRRISKLNKFKLHTRYDDRFEYHIHNWIRYAVKCNVQHLHLTLSGCAFPLDDFVFSGSCFTDLTLSGCAFNPTGAISWEKLRSLHIWHANLDEDLIENILRGSPVLETLVLNDCYGYRRINIMSRSVKKLVFAGYNMHRNHPDVNVIEINAPNILSLTIQDNLVLSKLLLLNVSSLVEVVLDYWTRLGRYGTTPEEAEEEMLEGLILNLLHVKELKIGISCFKVLARLKAKGFNPPSNLRVPDVTSSHLYTYDGHTGEDLIENILSGSPVLETLVLDYCYGYRRLNITSKSVKNLVFSGYDNFPYVLDPSSDIIEINAPNILILKLQGFLALRKLLLLNVSSLVEADLDCMKISGLYERHSEEDEEEMLKGFILNLLHVKDLKIGILCIEVQEEQVNATTSNGGEDGECYVSYP